MSLDSWLSRQNPRINVTSPAKRMKRDLYDAGTSALPSMPSLPGPPSSANSRKRTTKQTVDTYSCGRIDPPPRLRRSVLTAVSDSDLPPEHTFGRRSLFGWTVSDRHQGDEHISSLECLPGAPLAVLGLDNGEVDLIECSTDPEQGVRNERVGRCIMSKTVPPSWPIVDLAAVNSQSVVCASKRGTAVLDLVSETVRDYREHEDDEITHLAYQQDMLAVSGSRGSIGLIDTRDPNSYQRLVSDTHSILAGPRANRQRPAISALTWAGPSMLASGSQANETVKFWDIRCMRKTPVMSTWGHTGQTKSEGGINGLRSTGDGGLWALTRGSTLLRLNCHSEQPEYRLASPDIKVSSPYQSLDLIPGNNIPAGHYNNRTRRNASPRYPLIASCSDSGVAIITEPSLESRNLDLDSSLASRLSVNSSTSALPMKTTAVRWHPFTQELVSVVANRGWETWAHNDPSRSSAKSIQIRMTALGGHKRNASAYSFR